VCASRGTRCRTPPGPLSFNDSYGKACSEPSIAQLECVEQFGGLAVSVAVGFFLTPAMLNHLGEKRFGIWTLASSLVGYFGLLEFGLVALCFDMFRCSMGRGITTGSAL